MKKPFPPAAKKAPGKPMNAMPGMAAPFGKPAAKKAPAKKSTPMPFGKGRTK